MIGPLLADAAGPRGRMRFWLRSAGVTAAPIAAILAVYWLIELRGSAPQAFGLVVTAAMAIVGTTGLALVAVSEARHGHVTAAWGYALSALATGAVTGITLAYTLGVVG